MHCGEISFYLGLGYSNSMSTWGCVLVFGLCVGFLVLCKEVM